MHMLYFDDFDQSDHKENVNPKPIIFQCLILYKFYITHMFWMLKFNFWPSGHLFYYASQEIAGRQYPSKNCKSSQ